MTTECAQCGRQFEAKTSIQRYCETRCRWDHYHGVDAAMSKRRRETGYAWAPVQPPKRVRVQAPKRRERTGHWKTALLLPDPQFGYRRLHDGTLIPFHDENALRVARQIAEAERPDVTIWLGDVLDLPMFGKYRQEPTFAQTFQPALDRAHEEIAVVAELSGKCRYLSGNHDERLHFSVIDNMMSAAGIRRAKAPPDEYPALSVPGLLRLNELGVEWVGGYPAGATYLNDRFAAIHGTKVGNNRQSAATMVVEDERVSVAFGHVHRIETTYRTRNTRGAPAFSVAHSPGCLCRIDGAVPSVKSGLDPFGKPIRSWENWQNGVSLVRYEERDGRWALESIPIFEGFALHRGQEFAA